MNQAISFHTKLAQYLVDDQLGKIKEVELGYLPDKECVTFNQLTLKSIKSKSFFPNLPTLPVDSRASVISKLPVAIIGGGVAGLRVAMMLEKLDIPYKLFEASDRYGGRAFTYHFMEEEKDGEKKKDDKVSKHNYFDVGAMRFPKNAVNTSVYELFAELDFTDQGGKGGKLIPYELHYRKDIQHFNGQQCFYILTPCFRDFFLIQTVSRYQQDCGRN
jgi:hypothetical protein